MYSPQVSPDLHSFAPPLPALAACAGGPHDKFGYSTIEKNGRLYVFPTNSQAHQQFNRTGEMGKSVTRIGAGPDGKTIIGPDDETLNAYLGS